MVRFYRINKTIYITDGQHVDRFEFSSELFAAAALDSLIELEKRHGFN